MRNERRLVALVGSADSGLLRYASLLGRLHRRSTQLAVHLGSNPARPEGSVAVGGLPSQGGVLTDKDSGVVLSTPGVVSYVEMPRRRPLRRLLELSAQEDTEALLVPESAGRSLAAALALRASCSVWFVPESGRHPLQRLLVPVDFSARSADALRAATGLASLSGGDCLALHVCFNDSVLTPRDHSATLLSRCAADYHKFTAAIDLLNVDVTPIFEEASSVARAILRRAEEHDVDLIVLASRGRGRIGNLLRPSLVSRVLRDCRVPVLVLKHFGACRGLLSLLRDPPSPAEGFTTCN